MTREQTATHCEALELARFVVGEYSKGMDVALYERWLLASALIAVSETGALPKSEAAREGLEVRYELACDGRRIAEQRVAELEATIALSATTRITDEVRLDWIIDNATAYGGGSGMTVQFRVPDSEDIRDAIDKAIKKGSL